MIAVGFICCDDTRFVRSPDAFRTGTKRAPIRLVVSRYEVVHPIDFVHVMSFAYSVPFWNDDTFRTLDGTAHVGFQFRAFHCTIAMNGIHFSVIVEKHAQVVDVTLHVVVFPWPLDVLRCVAL